MNAAQIDSACRMRTTVWTVESWLAFMMSSWPAVGGSTRCAWAPAPALSAISISTGCRSRTILPLSILANFVWSLISRTNSSWAFTEASTNSCWTGVVASRRFPASMATLCSPLVTAGANGWSWGGRAAATWLSTALEL